MYKIKETGDGKKNFIQGFFKFISLNYKKANLIDLDELSALFKHIVLLLNSTSLSVGKWSLFSLAPSLLHSASNAQISSNPSKSIGTESYKEILSSLAEVSCFAKRNWTLLVFSNSNWIQVVSH